MAVDFAPARGLRTLGKATLDAKEATMSSAAVPRHPSDTMPTRGVVFIQRLPSSPPVLTWSGPFLRYSESTSPSNGPGQPVAPGSVRGELSRQAPRAPGRPWPVLSSVLRFEVTEEPTSTREGERFCGHSGLGMFRATIGIHGDMMLSEDRVHSAMADAADSDDLTKRLRHLLGAEGTRNSNRSRLCREGASVRWLRRSFDPPAWERFRSHATALYWCD